MIGSFTSIKKQLKKREMSREIEYLMIDNQYAVNISKSMLFYSKLVFVNSQLTNVL